MWGKWLLALCLLCAVPNFVAARDPFAEQVDPCASQAVSLWKWRGVINDGKRYTALFFGTDGKWIRAREGSELQQGLRIVSVTPDETIARGSSACPGTLSWKYKEKQGEGSHRVTVTSVAASQREEPARKQGVTQRGRRTRHPGVTGTGGE